MSKIKRRIAIAASGCAVLGATLLAGLPGGPSANADPKQYTDPIFGFGSDTIQDVTNAFAGYSNGTNYLPLQTSAATGRKQLVSWDAFPAGAADPTANDCIVTKVSSPTILRPNGSSNGQRALSAAFNVGQKWPLSGTPCGATRSMGGLIDFARSSSGPGTLANVAGPLAWIPFAQDALSFAYIRPSGSPVTSLTRTELIALHGTGPQLIGTTPVIACGIQTSSGTYTTFMGQLGLATNGTGDPGTNLCNNAGATGRSQENNGPDLLGKSTLLSSIQSDICDGVAGGSPVACTNAELIIGFSASQWIARSNGVGTPAPGLGANGGLGAANGVSAIQGTVPNLAPVPAAFNDAVFGRSVYNVVPVETFEGADALPHIVDMFVGPTSKVCSATTLIQQYGFLPLTSGCGSTTTRGNFRTS